MENKDQVESQIENLTAEQLIMSLIYSNEIDNLKELGIKTKNMNFLEPFQEIDFDQKITPLIQATYLGRYDVVRLLLENQLTDIDQSSEDIGHTPLTAACTTGNFEILKLLVEAGAEVNKPTNVNSTPFLCCFQRLEEEQNVFENRKICLKMAEILLQFGTDIDWIIDKTKGYTLLMQLCSIKMEMTQKEIETNYEIIKFLLENGANRNILTSKGRNLLDLTKKHCNSQNVQDLIINSKQIYFWNQKPDLKTTKQKLEQIQNDNSKKNSNSVIKYLAICKN